MKRVVAAASLFLVCATCEPAIRRKVLLTFNESADRVTISASTILDDAKPGTPEAERVESEREALLAGQDEWSVRFANAGPQSDRLILDRRNGVLQSVEHVATIAPDDLQRFFFDTHLTITFTRREGLAELTIYPGSSDRANRAERERVDRTLKIYSGRAARYFETVRGMYLYLDEKPHRAQDMFEGVLRDDKDPPVLLSDDEEKIVNGVRDAMAALLETDNETASLDRDFDRAFDPFPAELRIVIPGKVRAMEGFTREDDRTIAVKLPSALEAVGMLEGRWITPDPVAAMINAPKDATAHGVAAALAAIPRRGEPVVSASDVTNALVDAMRPAPRYRVQWFVRTGKD